MSYFGYRALELENGVLSVAVTPEAGGKIVSLYDRRTGREWLVTPKQSNAFRAWPYGTEYNRNQCGGWDEMIPTIVACPYPGEGVYERTPLPDHGEAWTLPWKELESDDGEIALEFNGQALPYRLRRTLSLDDDALRLAYTLDCLGDASLAYLWAAHPQFACDPGATIVLPDQVADVINVLPTEWGPEFGPPSTRNRWPSFERDGRMVAQDLVAGPDKHGGRKFYLPPDHPIEWGELRQPTGESLRMSWDASFAPYCGVWIDEGYLNTVSDMAFEPTTGYYDSLASAWANGRCSIVGPGATAGWELRVQLVAR
jgi:hypothetical protein